jgi:hypothetical protein
MCANREALKPKPLTNMTHAETGMKLLGCKTPGEDAHTCPKMAQFFPRYRAGSRVDPGKKSSDTYSTPYADGGLFFPDM